jgi:LmbE family N-acetylglucosaminyl deacetylase
VHAAELSAEALFYSGLRKIETHDPASDPNDAPQAPWRPDHVLHYMQTLPFEPTFVVDVSDVWPQRIEALLAFRSQFHHPDYTPAGDEPETFISNPDFFRGIEARARTYGQLIGVTYGEPFLYRNGPVGVSDLVATLRHEKAFA